MSYRKVWLFLIVAMLVLMMIVPTWAQTFNLNLVGRDPFGEATDIYVSDNYAYVCVESTLLILNVANPSAPSKVNAIEIPDTANSVFVSGGYAYVAYGDTSIPPNPASTSRNENGLYIINVYNPAAPGLVGDYPMSESANGVFVVGSTAYVTSGNFLYGINVANRSNPTYSWKTADLGDTAGPVYAFEGFAYVAVDDILKKVNLTSPYAVSGTYTTAPDTITGIFVTTRTTSPQKIAYITSGNSVRMVNIANMELVGTPSTAGDSAKSVHGVGNYICTAFSNSGLVISDQNLVEVEPVDTDGSASGVFAVGSYAYVADGWNGVCTIGPLGATAAIKGYYVPFVDDNGNKKWDSGEIILNQAKAVSVYGNYAYVACPDASLRVLSLSNFSNPTAVSAIHTPGQANDVVVQKNTFNGRTYAYVADGISGLRIIDVTNPNAPSDAGSKSSIGYAIKVFVVERGTGVAKKVYAFVAAETSGLHVLDVTDPGSIGEVLMGWKPSLSPSVSSIRGVYVEGNYVYVIGDSAQSRLCVAVISEQPTWTLEFDTSGGKKPYSNLFNNSTPNDIYVSGNYAYIAVEGLNTFGGNGGLWCVEVSNPSQLPTYILDNSNFADTYNPATGVHVSGNYAYVTSMGSIGGSFHVFYLSSQAAPSKIKLDESPDNATSVFVSGIYAYVTDEVKGLYVYAANTHTITATAGDNGRISPSGVIQVANNGSQKFTITPDKGYSIKRIRTTSASGQTADITVDKPTEKFYYTFNNVVVDYTINATFEESRFTITATAGANGIIIPSGVTTKKYDESATFTFAPNTGYDIDKVQVDGSPVVLAADNSYTISNIKDNHTIDVAFKAKKFIITASAGANGSINPTGNVEVSYGTNQTFAITPNTGYAVKDVLVDGISVGAVTSHTFTSVSATHTISATFAPLHNIAATAVGNGTISPAGTVVVADGGSKKFTFTPITGYHVADVKINDISIGVPSLGNEYTFTNVLTNQKIEVSFAINGYIIEASSDANGVIIPAGTTTVTHGGSKSFSITPNLGYHIKDVKVDGASITGTLPSGYTFANVTSQHTIAVTFEINTYTVTATAGENGQISPLGTVNVNYGASQTFNITPNAGYHVADVKVDGISVGVVATHTISNVVSSHTISATFAINIFKITTTVEGSGTVSPSGEVSVNYLDSKTFTMTPSRGYHVKDVLLDGFSMGPLATYTVVGVTSNRTLKVVFTKDIYILRSSTNAHGTISPLGETRVEYGESVTFTITIEAGYQIDYVKIDGELVDEIKTTYSFENVTKNHAIYVAFVRSVYEITPTAGEHGSISPSILLGGLIYGANQLFTITPDAGYRVADVLVDGVSVGAVTSYQFTGVDADHTIVATFVLKTYTVTASAGEHGTISPSGTTTVNHGSSVKFTVTPDANYHIAGLLVDGLAFVPASEYTFANISANHTISVTFAINTYTITASAGLNGNISPAGAVIVNHGANQTFTMIPIVGNQVADIKVDGISVGIADTYTITNVTSNKTISVTFGAKTYTITATAEGPGTISPAGDVKLGHAGMKIFVIKPNSGARLVDVVIDGNSMGPLLAYQFTNVIANHTISAIFEQKDNVLMQNFPNPFNPETWIPFELKENSEVKIRIYNSTGRLVRELNLGSKVAGMYATPDKSAYWDGKDESGVSVASGIYFYSIQAGKFNAVKKMIVSR